MTRAEALHVGAGFGIWLITYFAMERGYDAVGCVYAFSVLCAQLHGLKDLVTAVLPAYLVGRRIGRAGLVFGAAVSLGGWLIMNLLRAMFGPGSFDAWHLLANYAIIGALAGGVGQLHRRPRDAGTSR